jgi:gamma-glutamyltranspeptidase/glutathione hydrolase
MSRMLRLTACLTLTASAAAAALRAADPPWIARSKTGMVASDSAEASQIGASVLATGGNAFDAAVATSFALAVARPESTGLGGGGFMVAYVAKEKRFVALDFRETAPAGATPERYARLFADRGDGPSPSVYGGNAVGVPGQLAGLAEINKRFGTRPLDELVQPALKLAKEGFAADEHFRDACQHVQDTLEKYPQLAKHCAAIRTLVTADGKLPQPGDRVRRPHVADALRLIGKDGPDAFYRGPIAEAVVQAVNDASGMLALPDLSSYRIKERTPLKIRLSTYPHHTHVVTMPPPSSGGVCFGIMDDIETFKSLEGLGDPDAAPDPTHVRIEAMKHAFAERARWLGDPDFSSIPVHGLTSAQHAIKLASRLKNDQTLPIEEYGSTAPPPDDGGTSHFCVADRDGNIVAITETINGSFGSLVVAEPYGIILNNEMDDFLTVRGEANLYGLVQGEANLVAPGKRPLSSMSPTIILKDGKPLLVLGASGGPRIITSVYQVAEGVINGQALEDAMTELRIHHQWLPDEVCFDREPPADLAERLESYGHKLSDQRQTGIVQAIRFLDDGTMVGASDPKKGGRPAGVP